MGELSAVEDPGVASAVRDDMDERGLAVALRHGAKPGLGVGHGAGFRGHAPPVDIVPRPDRRVGGRHAHERDPLAHRRDVRPLLHAPQQCLLPLDNVPRALAARDTRGVIKLVADTETDRLLGGVIMAPEGADSVQTLAMALKAGMTIKAPEMPSVSRTSGPTQQAEARNAPATPPVASQPLREGASFSASFA